MEKRVLDSTKYSFDNLVEKTNNSKLYINDGFMEKMFYKGYTPEELEIKEKKLELLSQICDSTYIMPEYGIYEGSTKTINLSGYGMRNYEDYMDLEYFIEKANLSHKRKLEISKKLCEIFSRLEKYGIAYWDVHVNNILINEKCDIKVCDMDSATINVVDGRFEYRVDLALCYKYLTLTILSLIYEIDALDLEFMIKEKYLEPIIICEDKRYEMFSRVIDPDGYLFHPDDYIDLFTEEYVEESKRVLKR